MTPEQIINDGHVSGYSDGVTGNKTPNPYPNGSKQHSWWLYGYQDGERQRRFENS